MWELDCEEGWVLKNWCFWTVVLEKPLESPLDCKAIQAWHAAIHGVAKSQKRLCDWTELNWMGLDAMILVSFVLFYFSVLSQLFHSPPSPSSRGSLVLLCFLRKRQLEFATYLNFKGLYLNPELLRSALLLKLYSSITLLSSKKLKIKKIPYLKIS